MGKKQQLKSKEKVKIAVFILVPLRPDFTIMLIVLSPAKTMNMSPIEHNSEGAAPMCNTDAEWLASKMRGYSQTRLLMIGLPLVGVNHVPEQ